MIRYLGFILIVCGGSGCGIMLARETHKTLELYLQCAIALTYMKNEMEFHLTAVDQIAFELSNILPKPLATVFHNLYSSMCVAPGIALGLQMEKAMQRNKRPLPNNLKQIMIRLFDLLGKQDLQAQLSAIQLAEKRINREIERINAEKYERSRTYRTIGICTGLALAIILI